MDRGWTATLGLNVPSVGENLLQDVTIAMRLASGSALTSQGEGIEARIYQATSDLATATLLTVDSGAITVVNTGVAPAVTTTGTLSWSDRMVIGFFRGFAGATEYPGGAGDCLFDDAGAPVLFMGYLGKGAKTGASAQVSAGSPPVPAAGNSWAARIAANLWLYLDPYDGALKVYNNTGATIRTPLLILFATAATGTRP